MQYTFEDYAFDIDRRELRRGAEIVSIAPQVFDLLEYLIRNRERVVGKDELIDAVWDGRIVSDAAVTTRLNVARSALGDSGQAQRLIKTLPRKGFRFVGVVQEKPRPVVKLAGPVGSGERILQGISRLERSKAAIMDGLASETHSGAMAATPISPPRLSIVVLPFANFSGDLEQDYFVDGITESLTTDLSRITGLLVIGRHTAFTYRSKAADLKKIGRELNVCYVLEGSVQRRGDRLRVNVQLIDAQTALHLWAERFDKPVADLFEMQDELVSRLANTLNAQLIENEARRAERSLHPDTMDLYFRGRHWWNKGIAPEYVAQARGFFERALAIDSTNIEAIVGMATIDVATGGAFLTNDPTPHLAKAEAALKKALSYMPNHARAHLVLGVVQILTNRAAHGITECERALALDHNFAAAHGHIGRAKIYLGRADETEAHINEALRLSPRDIRVYLWLQTVGHAKLQLEADAEAVDSLLRSIEANRNYHLTHFFLAAALALLGSRDQARIAVKAGLALIPGFTIRRFREGVPSDHPTFLAGRERIYKGLRMAGVPEG